jgi:hypothetical protein
MAEWRCRLLDLISARVFNFGEVECPALGPAFCTAEPGAFALTKPRLFAFADLLLLSSHIGMTSFSIHHSIRWY